MIDIKGKQYNVIFFDWLNTLYSPNTQMLFPWVSKYFINNCKKTQNYLITKSSNTNQNLEDGTSIVKCFEKVYLDIPDKEKVFNDIIRFFSLKKEEILVIGDNDQSELLAAKNIGIDSIHVNDFTSIVEKW